MNFFYLFFALVIILTLIIAYTVGLEYYLRRKHEHRKRERRGTDRRKNHQPWIGVERREGDRRHHERRNNFHPEFA